MKIPHAVRQLAHRNIWPEHSHHDGSSRNVNHDSVAVAAADVWSTAATAAEQCCVSRMDSSARASAARERLMEAALRHAVTELARGVSTGLVLRAGLSCPECAPVLTCPACPDCVCTHAGRVSRERPACSEGSSLVWLILVCLVGAACFLAGRASIAKGPVVAASGKIARGKGVLRDGSI